MDGNELKEDDKRTCEVSSLPSHIYNMYIETLFHSSFVWFLPNPDNLKPKLTLQSWLANKSSASQASAGTLIFSSSIGGGEEGGELCSKCTESRDVIVWSLVRCIISAKKATVREIVYALAKNRAFSSRLDTDNEILTCRYIVSYSDSVKILLQKVSSGENRRKTMRRGSFSKERRRNKRD